MYSKRVLCAVPLLLVLGCNVASAQQDGAALVSKAMCYACHQMNDASIGPPWAAIAARYASRKDVIADVLVSKILRGGGGNWGLVPMVPNQRVSTEAARTMVEWILQQNSGNK